MTCSLRLVFALFVGVAVAVMAQSSMDNDMMRGAFYVRGHVGGSFLGVLDMNQILQMEAESGRRNLNQQRKYISYSAIDMNNVPCGRRGHSYYDCNAHLAAPKRRGALGLIRDKFD
ncbi:unnamed protein product [Fraxinus pennsylvanica]|uniref:Uncharacterized protein n=1 Tax=Fraxinus pennsylvanica TaxID=56036 RepID=A0AAD2DK23_9LAMI|nr:unnamed protein product [Fraxinus pennsylvanica]